MSKIHINSIEKFIVGNLGPDCGVPNEDWSEFNPATEISHWKNNKTRTIDSKGFYDKYCSTKNCNDFYLGYFTHLLTDSLWSDLVLNSKKEEFKDELSKNNKFIWLMKEDWYDLDKKYILENELLSFLILKQITDFPNIYLDYFPKNAFTQRIKYIVSFYEEKKLNPAKEYKYLNENEMNLFIKEATVIIEKTVLKKSG
ncbi:MAG: hypothetical protein JXL97_14270 [Bacteroidales bacterium]|nr:hypothetical protein [Bacteroidales bacterium]